MHEKKKKKKRNIEDIPFLNSYIVLTIIVAVTLIWGVGVGRILYCPTVLPTAKVLLLFRAIAKKMRS